MLVRMLTYLAWPGNPCEAGQTIDLPERDAMAYIRSGQAEIVEPAARESATIQPVTNAMRRHEPRMTKRG